LAGEGILRRILEPLDAFDRAIADLEMVSREGSDGGKAGIGRTLEGLRGVRRLLGDLLASEGVEAIVSDGVPFDPHVHEALVRVPSATSPEGTVVQTLQSGYSMRGRLLRPARVAVSSGPLARGPENAPSEPAAESDAPKVRLGRRESKAASPPPSPDGTAPNPSNPEHS
jgi:molecular chaperone GrpE